MYMYIYIYIHTHTHTYKLIMRGALHRGPLKIPMTFELRKAGGLGADNNNHNNND